MQARATAQRSGRGLVRRLLVAVLLGVLALCAGGALCGEVHTEVHAETTAALTVMTAVALGVAVAVTRGAPRPRVAAVGPTSSAPRAGRRSRTRGHPATRRGPPLAR